jgi:phosphate transport system ATP-binding protein
MHDLYTHNAVIRGKVLVGDDDVYSPQTDTEELRRKVGMIFQKPNPFPYLSIFENVAAGIRLHGLNGKTLAEQVENNLQRAALWEEVKDRLNSSPLLLSGGQQQRLCIARALAVQPEVFLMDEPCASLDPISTQRIEDLLLQLKKEFTIVIVTHNMQQAARISDRTAFILQGELVEVSTTSELFLNARDARTEAYLTGKIG